MNIDIYENESRAVKVIEFFQDHAPMVIAGGVLAALIGLVFYAVYREEQRHERLVAQCIADGNKPYQCEALFKECSSNTVFIPMKSGR